MAHAEAAQDVDPGSLLDGEDVFVHPDDIAGGGDSANPPDLPPRDGENPNPGPAEPGEIPGGAEGQDGGAEGQDGAATVVPEGTGNAPPKPDPGTRLLYASVDVEFSQSNKFIGEIFQMSVVLFATETVTAKGDGPVAALDMQSNGWSSFVKPSLLFGKAEFAPYTTKVGNCAVAPESRVGI